MSRKLCCVVCGIVGVQFTIIILLDRLDRLSKIQSEAPYFGYRKNDQNDERSHVLMQK